VGMGVNAVLTAAKFAAGILGHSHALTADAVESTADVLSSIIVWRGLIVAAEPPDREHPYGHGKAEPLAAASVAIMLFLAGVGIIIKSAAELTHPRERPRVFTLAVLLVVFVVKDRLAKYVEREAESAESIAVHTDAGHHRADAITSLAAAIGITFSLIGGPSFYFADDAAAILAGLIIVWNAWQLIRPALNELMDASPNAALIVKVKSIAARVSGVNAVEKCIIRKAGFEYFVDMHIEVDPQLTVQEAHVIAHNVKNRVREVMPSVRDVLVHIEPFRGIVAPGKSPGPMSKP
jgi:cation diffusion facilitator family transporter